MKAARRASCPCCQLPTSLVADNNPPTRPTQPMIKITMRAVTTSHDTRTPLLLLVPSQG